MGFDSIPAELRHKSQWFCWRVEQREGKPTKAPIIPGTYKHAATNDPSTWRSFDQALTGMNGHSGLGFVLTADLGIVGIDADHCIYNDGKLAPWAQSIITNLNSYSELSPSGTGVHIWVKATLPQCHKIGSLEMYDRGRYLTVSGNHVSGTPATIESRDLSWLFRLQTARVFDFTSEKYRRLMMGDYSGYPSQSEADLALCSFLANLGLPEPDIDSAFRLSGLYRDKWERGDYRDTTIRTALTRGTPKAKPMATATGAAVAADWHKQLICAKDSGSPLRILANAVTALRHAPEWAGVLAHNEFAQRTIRLRPTPWGETAGDWHEQDDLLACDWLHHAGIFVHAKVASEAVEIVAHERKFNPLKQYLEGLVWDGTERIDYWLPGTLGTPETEYTRQVGSRFLISAVARAFHPGCQADHCLVLEGMQGSLKSTALRTLFGDEWFTDHISDLGGKDSRIELLGRWCIELSELSAVRRGEVERVKAFLTCRIDHFRPPYGRRAEAVPRSCVFAATTNSENPFTDETGARRFWPVSCGVIDVEAIRSNRDQLWAEAVFRFKRGDPWWLDTTELNTIATEEQEARFERSARADLIEAWIGSPRPRHSSDGTELPWRGSQPGKVNVSDVLIHGLDLRKGDLKPQDSHEVARCLRHLGWQRKRESTGPYRGTWYFVSPNPPGWWAS